MKDIIREEMKHGVVYITGDLHPDSFFEVACLDSNNRKISIVIPNYPRDGVLVTNDDEPWYTFEDYAHTNNELIRNFWRGDFQEILFCWMIYKKLWLAGKSGLSYKERLEEILENAKNTLTEDFVITLNDNLNAISRIDCSLDKKSMNAIPYRIHVDSAAELAQDIRDKYDDLWHLADKVHLLAFDFVWARALGEDKTTRNQLLRQIFENKRTFTSLAQQRYDFDFRMTEPDWFNNVIMPATRIE